MDISKIKIGNTVYDIKDATARANSGGLTSSDVQQLIYSELYGQTTKPSGATTVTSENLATTLSGYLQTGDIAAWAKAADKPSYVYSEIGYTVTPVTASSSTLTLAGTDPIYVVTVSANLSSVTLTANPSAGHSCHVFFVTNSNDSNSYTVTIGHDSTNRICPAGTDLLFTVPKNGGGYIEVDFLNANNKVYVRGV